MTLRNAIHTLAPVLRRGLGDALLPQRCIVCGRYGAAMHKECLDALPGAAPPRCPRCWLPTAGGPPGPRRPHAGGPRCAAPPPPSAGAPPP
ncbi:MAG: hypothetical protein OXC71_09830, partial [Chloroflexi bacterium]|nr:hypothetical protein [Chloroflexota bacterium]